MISAKWIHHTNDLKDVLLIRNKMQHFNTFLESVNDFDAFHIVVYENEIPVAIGLLEQTQHFFIRYIFVKEKFRSRGYGDLVVRMFIRKVFSLGEKYLMVESPRKMTEFFQKYHFQPVENSSSASMVTMVCKQDVEGQCHVENGMKKK